MFILGIDPSLTSTGMALIETGKDAKSYRYIDSECVKTTKKNEMPERLLIIHTCFSKFVESYGNFRPLISIESPFAGRNANTALSLGMVRGNILLTLALNSFLSINTYAPAQIKLAVAGSGKADKEMMEQCVRDRLISAPKRKLKEDEIDALATAMTHHLKMIGEA